MQQSYAKWRKNANTQLTLTDYVDSFAVHDWAREEVTWAIENSIYMGTLYESSKLKARSAASRALVAEMFYMYNEVYN